MTCSSAPQVNASPMNTSWNADPAVLRSGIDRGVIPNFSRAFRAASVNDSVSSISTCTFGPARASISSSTLRRFDRACTNGSGTVGLMNAWMKTGRSSDSSAINRRVSPLTEWSCSAVTSSRRLTRPTRALMPMSATATATALTVWWTHIGYPSATGGQWRRLISRTLR